MILGGFFPPGNHSFNFRPRLSDHSANSRPRFSEICALQAGIHCHRAEVSVGLPGSLLFGPVGGFEQEKDILVLFVLCPPLVSFTTSLELKVAFWQVPVYLPFRKRLGCSLVHHHVSVQRPLFRPHHGAQDPLQLFKPIP